MPTYRNDSNETQSFNDLTENHVVPPSHSVETDKILLESFWTKITDAPYFNLAENEYTKIASAAGTLSQSVNARIPVFEVSTNVDVVLYANSASAKGYSLKADNIIQIRNNQNIEAFYIVFSGAGEVLIKELAA